jgi:hypothetical protein
MKLTVPHSYSLYDMSYGNDVPAEQAFIHNFGKLPSSFLEGKKYDSSILEHFKKNGFEEVSRAATKRRSDDSLKYLLVNMEKKIFIIISNSKFDNIIEASLQILYDIANGDISEQINLEEVGKFEKPKKKSQISLVKSEMGHLDTHDYDLSFPEMDLELNYGSGFNKVHDVIMGRLNKENDKGIVLLHGDPGTGKTSYIKYLTKQIKDKEILFIPPSMAEILSEPSIIPFLMDHKNSILIIEDAERVISDRQINGSSPGVSNILNLTDGILGDCLSIQIIATFNMKREKIDSALLRKGRLIAEHKFQKLNVDETNKLLKHINKDVVVNEGLVLSDIYNIDVEEYKSTNDKQKIGF